MINSQPQLVVAARLITSLAYYMIIPFLVYFLVQLKGLSPIHAGIIIAALNIARRCCGIVGGYVCGRLGTYITFLGGILLEGVSYSSLAIAQGFPMLLTLATLVGVGGSLMNVSARVILADHARAQEDLTTYSTFYIVMHIGALFGPIATSLIMDHFHPSLIFYSTAATYTVLMIIVACRWPPRETQQTPDASPFRANVRYLLHDLVFLKFCLAIIGCWFLSTQIYISFPMYLMLQQIDESQFSLYIALNALLIILFQYPLGKFLQSKEAHAWRTTLTLGSMLMSGAWLLCALPLSVHGWLCCIIIFTIGEILFLAVVDPLTAHFAPTGKTAEYVGVAMCSWGIGAGLCSVFGGYGLAWAQQHSMLNIYWLFIAGIGVFCCYFLTTICLTHSEEPYEHITGHGARCGGGRAEFSAGHRARPDARAT